MGTAGHIDHGKTSLVKALTGHDTDRLREEKERGITIVLGFCGMTTDSGDDISIVDVPGHEKFIKAMISGAAGIDMVMLVIAADDGVMPQTREHLEICRLLGIRHGFVALTKCDLVDQDWLELVTEDITKFTAGTFLGGAPVVRVSAATNDGIDELKSVIMDTAKKVGEREITGLPRLPVDRVFTMKGFGTVVTGTLISGELSTGDIVELLPGGESAKIRSLQQHGMKVETAFAGSRVAVNLASFEKDESIRGELLVKKDTFTASSAVDVHLTNVSAENITIKNRSTLRFLTLTTRAMAKALLYTGAQIKPGEEGYARLLLDKPLPCVVDDKFILLGTSKIQTIGGGTILNPHAKPAPRKGRAALIAELASIKDSDAAARAEIFIRRAATNGISLRELSLILNIKEKLLFKTLAKPLSAGVIIQFDRGAKSFVSKESFGETEKMALSALNDFHKNNPAKAGMVKEELKSRVCGFAPLKLYEYALKSLVDAGEVTVSAELVMLKDHESDVTGFAKELKEELCGIFIKSGLTPPFLQGLKSMLTAYKPTHVRDTIDVLVREKILIKISDGYYLHIDTFNSLQNELVEYLNGHDSIDAGRFKEMTNTSRKYAIPLMERFDMMHVTVRQPDNTRRLAAAFR